jgi:predicted NAD-dependent protein-ADP-ribosyltransferase YbiA (DUF1768 family)
VEADGTKTKGPACTDNFQVHPFAFRGQTWHSAEQAYQANKFPEGSRGYLSILHLTPDTSYGETDKDFGLRAWSEGQRETPVSNWDDIKVETMYLVNCAKYASSEALRQELLSTGDVRLRGGPSTW